MPRQLKPVHSAAKAPPPPSPLPPPTRPLAGHRAAAAGGAKLEVEQPLVAQHYEAAARQEVEAAGGMFGLVEQHQLRERMGGE